MAEDRNVSGNIDNANDGTSTEPESIELGSTFGASESLRVEQSDGTDRDFAGGSVPTGKPKRKYTRRQNATQTTQVPTVTAEQLTELTQAVDMLFLVTNMAAVSFAGTTDAQMGMIEEALIKPATLQILSRASTLQAVNKNAPYLALSGGLLMWGVRVARLRAERNVKQNLPAGFETDAQTTAAYVNGAGDMPDTAEITTLLGDIRR